MHSPLNEGAIAQPTDSLLTSITIGLTTGTLGVLFDLSFASLIFANNLAEHLSVGVGFVLVSAALTRIMVALMSSFPGMVADLGTVPTAIMAWSVGMVVRQLPTTATSTELLVTAIATMAMTSLITGLFLWLLGVLSLGGWVKLLPRPVVGGFVASTGWLLVKGAFKLMMGQPLGLDLIPLLSHPSTLIQWLPGMGLALYLLGIAFQKTRPLLMSISLVVAVGLFYLLVAVTHTTAAVTLALPQITTPWQVLQWSDLASIKLNRK